MKKTVFLVMILLALSTLPLCLEKAEATSTLRVPQDYPTIQAAIDASSSDDTIFVESGIYNENPVVRIPASNVAYHGPSIIGQSSSNTVVNGNFTVYDAKHVSIVNLDIRGGLVIRGHSYSQDDYHCVSNCVVRKGVYFGTSSSTIVDSTIYGNITVSPTQNHGLARGDRITSSTIVNGGVILWEPVGWGGNHNHTIGGNTFIDAPVGVWETDELGSTYCGLNNIERNSFVSCEIGVKIDSKSAKTLSNSMSTISGNVFERCGSGVMFIGSAYNVSVFGNSFIDNTVQASADIAVHNVWDNNYSGGGNYWSDYQGTDVYRGPDQNIAGSDGIGDTPYVINVNNTDRYPLMRPWALASYLVVRGLDNRVYYRLYDSSIGPWRDWHVVPTGATCDGPAATFCQNKLHIVVRGMDGSSLWYGSVDTATDAFSGWTRLDGSTPSPPTLVSNGTALCLVVRGQDNRIYYRYYMGSWGNWYVIPNGATCDGPAAVMLGNNLYIVVRSMDQQSLWRIVVSSSGSVLRNWALLSGTTHSKPVLAVSQSSDKFYLVVRGDEPLNSIYYRECGTSTDSWGSWVNLPGATIDGASASVLGNKLYVIVRGESPDMIWNSYVDLSSSAFSGWLLLDGSTPSVPMLAPTQMVSRS